MTLFERAFQRTMDFEGRVLTNDPHDPGGQTYWGISRKNNPGWPGWNLIDLKQDVPESMVEGFYFLNYWEKAKCEFYNSEELSIQVFDAFVNLGQKALKLLQNLVGTKDDGVIGDATLEAMDKQNGDYLADNYIEARAAYYRDLAYKKPELARYLNGWLKRCVRSAV